jgi:hypothetical protein
MTNRDTYELMYNLINEYYINWRNVVHILLDDAQETTKKLKTPLIIIFSFYFIFSIAMIIASLKLLAKFSLDREKPINLFLTIKKGVFENLKNCAENFSNKLLNKFFGNDDKEEESQQEYQTNIKPSDINIVKFKAASNNSSIKKSFAFFNNDDNIPHNLFYILHIKMFQLFHKDVRTEQIYIPISKKLCSGS